MASGRSLAGRWHLVAAAWSGDQLPDHRVDLVFHDEPEGLRGAVLSRIDGSEIIPLQSLAFNGEELRLKMGSPPDQQQEATDSPVLVLKAVADSFEGAWDRPGMEHIRIKLMR